MKMKIKKMLSAKGGELNKEEANARETFENGISVEGEFAFVKAVGSYCKEAVREGRFKGSYKLNIKEQLAQRASVEKRKMEKVRVVIMGGSQMGRGDCSGFEKHGKRLERGGGENQHQG
jgi:hypothetical protein